MAELAEIFVLSIDTHLIEESVNGRTKIRQNAEYTAVISILFRILQLIFTSVF